MKRRATRIVLFLFLGAILNIAIAWTCVLNPWHAKARDSRLELVLDANWWLKVAPPDMSVPTQAERMHLPGVEQDILSGESRPSADQRLNVMLIEQAIRKRAGLPLPSMHGDVFNHVRVSSDNMSAQDFHWAMRPPEALISSKIIYQRPFLPLAPLWPGFAINTIFYAALSWLPMAGIGALRRRRRLKRGLCPVCAYPIGNSAVCSECGNPTKSKRVVPVA